LTWTKNNTELQKAVGKLGYNMEDSILKLITIGYALGIAIVGVMAYLGIKGTNEAIDYQNSRLRQHDKWRKNDTTN
jgi:hypothetical protein